MTSGRILHLQRLSTEDGPGLRTTVFFKGCPLHCAWCHNPESLSAAVQTQWYAVRCIGCETCLSACPNGCLTRAEGVVTINRERCQGCGTCARACPSGALEALGRSVTVEEMVSELVRDRAFYEKSGGGVTLSGGEPTFQPEFAEGLLSALSQQGIATALDTCGLCSARTLERLLPFTDLVLFDLKFLDAEQHRTWTGQSNERILQNLALVREQRRSQGRPADVWIRTPLIPGATACEANLQALGQYIHHELDGVVSRWELCAFNNLCRDQYARLGMTWAFADAPLLTSEELARWGGVARQSGVAPEIVHATGATRPVG